MGLDTWQPLAAINGDDADPLFEPGKTQPLLTSLFAQYGARPDIDLSESADLLTPLEIDLSSAGARHRDRLLANVRRITQGPLAASVERIDREGLYPRTIMKSMGQAGALSAHLVAQGGDFGLAIDVMREAGRICGSTAYLMWCHAVCGLLIEQSGNPVLTGDRLARHACGDTFGGTGLSNPIKAFDGLEPMALKARRVDGGYIINGTLPWVSHIGPEHYFGAVAVVEEAHAIKIGPPVVAVTADGQVRSQEVMFLLPCNAAGVELKVCPAYPGTEGTNTWSVRVVDHFVGAEMLIADPAKPLIDRIRAPFILLQTGIGLGVTQGAIDSIWQVDARYNLLNRHLDHRPDALQTELEALVKRIGLLAATPYETGDDYLYKVLEARAQVAELTLKAAQSALLHHGSRGYLVHSPVQRRLRESHFIAIVTPAIRHLRKEMARLGRVSG